MKVVTIKAITGETLIARRIERTNAGPELGITFEDVRIVGLVQNPNGQIGIQLLPWISFSPNSVVSQQVWHDMTVLEVEPPLELQRIFQQAVSGIALA